MRRARSLAVILLIALPGVLWLSACGETESADDHFQKGNEFAQAGDFESAIVEFKAALEKDPKNVSAMSNLGVVYYNLGQLDEAIEQYESAIGIAPEDADIHSNLAAAYVQQGQLDRALEEYQTAVTINPELAEAYFGLGVVYFQMGKTDESIQAFESFQRYDSGRDSVASSQATEYLEKLKGQ